MEMDKSDVTKIKNFCDSKTPLQSASYGGNLSAKYISVKELVVSNINKECTQISKKKVGNVPTCTSSNAVS